MSERHLPQFSYTTPLIDQDVRIDAFESARLEGAALRVTTASGEQLQVECTVPLPGVLRVRIAATLPEVPAPCAMLLPGLGSQPAELAETPDVIRITGEGVDAAWPLEGGALRCGPYERVSRIRWGTEPLDELGAVAGRWVGPDGSCGWVESAALAPDAAVYGGGESFQGPNLRGRVRRLVNRDPVLASGFDFSYLNVPLFWSDAGWGMFVLSGGPVWADLGWTHSEIATIATEDDVLDVFLITGDAPSILGRYVQITGLPGRFPDWAYGIWTSRCSYLNAAELEQIVDGYREADCPVDVVHVDNWGQQDIMQTGSCDWMPDRDRFPHGWTQELHDKGVRVSLWQNPYLMTEFPVGAEAVDRGFVPAPPGGQQPPRATVDFTNPAAVQWWADLVESTIRTEGNDAFKPDFGEEIGWDGIFFDGRTARQLRNEYAVRYQSATHAGMVRALGEDAVALFCRSGSAGSQRYPCHWVGDTPSTWMGLVTALRACLSLSMSGFAFVAHDVGGFWTPQSLQPMIQALRTHDPDLFFADVEPELFARWTQWGAFSPVMRFHGTCRREPWAYPEPARTVAIEACRLRSRLRDYLVRTGAEASATGTPVMRPMPLACPGNREARDADLQYLLGPRVLVAPVLQPGGGRTLYVPEGRWLPLSGLDPVEGPGWTTVDCPLDAFPAWTREGEPSPLAR